MFTIISKKTHARLTAQARAGKDLVDLVDGNFLAMDSKGNTGSERDVVETAAVWVRFHDLVRKIFQ